MNLFAENAGRVVLVPDAGFPLAVTMTDWPGAPSMKAIITGFQMSSQGNFQFMHTLRNFVYVYVFGERVGEIIISGLGFASFCNQQTPQSGLENVWSYYENSRISTRGSPLSIAVGSRMSFNGFLTGFNANFADPQSGLTQFAMRFHFLPPETAAIARPTFEPSDIPLAEEDAEAEESLPVAPEPHPIIPVAPPPRPIVGDSDGDSLADLPPALR